jgi:phage portal protein BeeE
MLFLSPFLRRVMSMGILQSIFKARDKPKDALGGSRYSFFFGGSTAGKPVNEHTAMQMTAVYSCVRILSETLAGESSCLFS